MAGGIGGIVRSLACFGCWTSDGDVASPVGWGGTVLKGPSNSPLVVP